MCDKHRKGASSSLVGAICLGMPSCVMINYIVVTVYKARLQKYIKISVKLGL
jgi:hypothetical protein